MAGYIEKSYMEGILFWFTAEEWTRAGGNRNASEEQANDLWVMGEYL